MAIRPHILRAIAAAELETIFPGQGQAAREELITAVVRQWATYGGNAGVFTISVHYWLTVLEKGPSVHAGTEVTPGTLKEHLGKWNVVERDLPHIVHDLSVGQSATLVNADGLTVRVHVDPRDHTFRFEEVPDDEE